MSDILTSGRLFVHPLQNPFVESFNGRMRDECLNVHWFRDLAEAQSMISESRDWHLGLGAR